MIWLESVSLARSIESKPSKPAHGRLVELREVVAKECGEVSLHVCAQANGDILDVCGDLVVDGAIVLGTFGEGFGNGLDFTTLC